MYSPPSIAAALVYFLKERKPEAATVPVATPWEASPYAVAAK
jgi:hypothetical protein